jgi:hypothetical protein
MAISFEKYVRITSGVVGNVAVRQRELIGRLFTENVLVSPGEVLEFTDIDDIKDFFGISSEEYKRAQFYFAWVSKQATRARKISFARYAPAGTSPSIYGGTSVKVLSSFITESGNGIVLSFNSVDYTTNGIVLTEATSLADVASAIEGAIRAIGDPFTSATVTYDAVTRRFILQVPVEGGSGTVSATNGAIVRLLEWTKQAGAIFINGAPSNTPAGTVSDSAELTNNFGSFLFLASLTDEEIADVSAWVDAQNVKYIYCLSTASEEGATSKYAQLAGYAGIAVTLINSAGDTGYPDMAPMIILAATDYTRRNSTCNYMYQQFNLTPTVTDTRSSNTLDAVRCNYYGETQTGGQYISFYQRGLLMGGSKAPIDMNTYANEMWLKDLAGTQIMSLLLSLQKVSANARGRTQVINILLPCIDAALYNGAISVEKPFTPTQKAFITEETGDENAWMQVQNQGYWLDCTIKTEVTTDGRTEYYAAYILIYSKDDVIRRVEGSHELI